MAEQIDQAFRGVKVNSSRAMEVKVRNRFGQGLRGAVA